MVTNPGRNRVYNYESKLCLGSEPNICLKVEDSSFNVAEVGDKSLNVNMEGDEPSNVD